MPLRERPRARHPPRPSFVRSASREIRYAQERACVPLPTAPGFGAPTRLASENLRGDPALRHDATLRAARNRPRTGSKPTSNEVLAAVILPVTGSTGPVGGPVLDRRLAGEPCKGQRRSALPVDCVDGS